MGIKKLFDKVVDHLYEEKMKNAAAPAREMSGIAGLGAGLLSGNFVAIAAIPTLVSAFGPSAAGVIALPMALGVGGMELGGYLYDKFKSPSNETPSSKVG
jgi:hypothetical protein